MMLAVALPESVSRVMSGSGSMTGSVESLLTTILTLEEDIQCFYIISWRNCIDTREGQNILAIIFLKRKKMVARTF